MLEKGKVDLQRKINTKAKKIERSIGKMTTTKKTKKSIWKVKEDIYRWLTRMGVHEGDITISSSNGNKEQAKVTYSYKNQDYNFSTNKMRIYRDNLHNIELLIHSRVLGIERGIETVEQAFAGYKALPDKSNTNYFEDCNDIKEIKLKFVSLAKALHPDVGGNIDEWNELNTQYNDLVR